MSHLGAGRGTFEFEEFRVSFEELIVLDTVGGTGSTMGATGTSREEPCLWHASVTEAIC